MLNICRQAGISSIMLSSSQYSLPLPEKKKGKNRKEEDDDDDKHNNIPDYKRTQQIYHRGPF